jgi:hypothetical protein
MTQDDTSNSNNSLMAGGMISFGLRGCLSVDVVHDFLSQYYRDPTIR